MGLQKCQYARHSGEGHEVSSFAPQIANSSPGARQAYLQSNRADGSQAVFGKPSQGLSGRGRCSVGVHHFGLDLVSMLSSAISQLQHPAGSCMTKAAAAAALALEALMPQRAAANQHAGIPGVYLRQATPLSRPACAVRVALQRVSHKCLNFTEATCRNVKFCSTLPALGSAAARNYCKLTGLTWARSWHCNSAVVAHSIFQLLKSSQVASIFWPFETTAINLDSILCLLKFPEATFDGGHVCSSQPNILKSYAPHYTDDKLRRIAMPRA